MDRTITQPTTEVPHNDDAERGVIGCLLLDNDARYALDLRPEDFFGEANRWTFEAALALETIDQVTLSTELARRGHLEGVGGVSYLSRVVADTPSSLHASHYADLVRQAAMQRRIITAAGSIAALAYEGKTPAEDVLRKAAALLQAVERHGEHSNLVGPEEYARRTLDHIGQRAREGNAYLSTSFPALDALIGGLRPGNLVVVGARPGVGKSQLLQQIVQHHYHGEAAVLVASAEMLPEEYGIRNVAMEQGMDIKRLVSGSLTDAEYGQLQPAIAWMSESRQYTMEGRIGVAEIRRQAQMLAEQHGLACIVVDYLQLLADRHGSHAGDNLRERIGYISGSLKQLALELRVPVVAASQLRRDVENRPDKRPTMADLKESGDIEQDADVIILLHRPELYDARAAKGQMLCYVAKCRQLGQIGMVRLQWLEKRRMYYEEERRLTAEESNAIDRAARMDI